MLRRGSIGFHASHEQFTPDRLLRLVQQAEQAGFDAAMCSDHWAPFGVTQGQSGFAWSWLGAALATTKLPLGVVNAPGQRYHPAIIAQAAATLGVMFPERFWLAIGSGQLINEHITGERWPAKAERNDRLHECADVMRKLWAGETVSHRSEHLKVSEAKLWTRPQKPPLLVGAAVTPTTAAWVATWADALITVAQADETLDEIVKAFRANGGENKPMYLQSHIAYAPTDAEAVAAAYDQWRTNTLPSEISTALPHPEQLTAATKSVRPEDMHAAVRISSDLGRHIEWIERDFARGFDAVLLHEVGAEQERFVEVFGEKVLPRINRMQG
jgi:coenzyme F420-dependent glucose-6-phosphate dehydrogenase